VNAIGQIRGPDQYLRLLTSYIGFRKEGLPYAPINRTGAPTNRPKGEAVRLARALVMDHSTHPLRTVVWGGVAIAFVNALVVTTVGWRAQHDRSAIHGALAFLVLAGMIALVGEYVGGLSQRMRDRPAYYVREEHTSSVLLREERKNVVSE
jgi:hypothetical protein